MNYYNYKNRSPFWTYLIAGLIGAIVGSLIMAYIAPTYLYGAVIPWPGQSDNKPSEENTEIQKLQINTPPNGDISVIPVIAKEMTPAVVGISTTEIKYDLFFRPIESKSVGSGVVVDSKGYILTNDHVVGNANKISVILSDGRHYEGKNLWSDPVLDLAVVKINADNLKVAPLGDSDKLVVGELAIAIGNP